jgi:endonuclease/exonuclease/phosphatase family metal-dependent hydrolase
LGKSFRILSANLKNGAADPDAFANLVASLAVDVLALQEVSFDQAEPLTRLFEFGEVVPHEQFVGRGLLCSHPVRIERIPLIWGFALTARLEPRDWNQLGGPVEVTNLHVAAPHMLSPQPGPVLRWNQGREFDAFLARADQASQPAPARLMVGDFNSTPGWPWYRRMALQFTDAATEFAAKAGTSTEPTWGPWPGGPKLLRIDHGFTRGLEVEGVEVLEIAGSDHSALVIDLAYPG